MSLVEDPSNGDSFAPGTIGGPIYFSFGALSFNGLLQRWLERKGTDGNPLWEVTITDPLEVLQGAQVILGAYGGSVGSAKNVLNVYGYWESFGFGTSQVNDAGMPFPRFVDGVLAIVNRPVYDSAGGPLTYRGFTYGLDLSQVPNPGNSYRLPGPSLSLLDAIALVCEDVAYDFFVDLVGTTIRVRTVPRRTQPPLGTITSLINSTEYSGSVLRAEVGVESRNEPTGLFLVGGDINTLHASTTPLQYWGKDINGLPLVSDAGYFLWEPRWTGAGDPPAARPTISLAKTQPPDNGDWTFLLVSAQTFEVMNFNASPVSNILGGVTYQCSTLELRLAQAGFEPWAAFLAAHRPLVAQVVGVLSPFLNMALGGALQAEAKPDVVREDAAQARALAEAAVVSDLHVKAQTFYEFVRAHAEEFLGRQYLVPLPLMARSLDLETGKKIYSYEVGDGGWWEEVNNPLGISNLNKDLFTGPDGRWGAFVRYDGLVAADFSRLPQDGQTVEGDSAFVGARAEAQVVFDSPEGELPESGNAYALLVLPGYLATLASDLLGGLDVLRATFQMEDEAQVRAVMERAGFGNVAARLGPAPRTPSAVVVPLKSNTLTYGPWQAQGEAGKVRFEQDSSLVPWNFGGTAGMNLAATSKVVQTASEMSVSESGFVELAGVPLWSLGDVMQAGMPNITGMDINYGPGGVTTSYRMQTFTPRFGVPSRLQVQRLARVAEVGREARRKARERAHRAVARAEAVGGALRTQKAWLENAPKAVKRESPHDLLVSHSFLSADGKVRVGVSTATAEEGVAFARADDPLKFRATSIASLSAIIRPFGVGPSGLYMPLMGEASVGGGGLNSTSLNPFQNGSDIELLTWGANYEGLHARRRGFDDGHVRGMALRMPQVGAGWGYGIDGLRYPGTAGGAGGSAFYGDYLGRQDLWPVGPVDHLWDPYRKVWTSHDVLRGTASGIPAGGSGEVQIHAGTGWMGWSLTAYNWGSTQVVGNVLAAYSMMDGRWYALPAGSGVGGGGGSSGGGSGTLAGVGGADGTPSYAGVTTLLFDEADGFVLSEPSPGVVQIDFTGGGGGTITVEESDFSPSYTDVTALQFIPADGFSVTQPFANYARVAMAEASVSQKGAVSTGAQTFGGRKVFANDIQVATEVEFDEANRSRLGHQVASGHGTTFLLCQRPSASANDFVQITMRTATPEIHFGASDGSAFIDWEMNLTTSAGDYTGAAGSFTTVDGKTVTVVNGFVVSIV